MINNMYKGILVYAEYLNNNVHGVTFELLNKSRELADKLNEKVYSVIIGNNLSAHAEELIYHGADVVYVYDSPHFRLPDIIIHKRILVDLINEIKPRLILIGATLWGRSLAPRIAAALKTGLTADCIDIELNENNDIIQIRPAFTGNIIAHIRTLRKPIMATVRYKVFSPATRDTSRKGEIIKKDIKQEYLKPTGIKVLKVTEKKGPKLTEAQIVVGVGKGLKSPEDIRIFKELAKLLGGVIGVSRPIVDNGWVSREYQVGFSGNIIKPKVYIACGISGSPQHLAGIRDSKIIIAINIDPSAPIFKYADYGIVGDMYEVVPKLIKYLKMKKNSPSTGDV